METALFTFLRVCETMNYRKASEDLHLSQPAISKQMKNLEENYGVKLFDYTNRRLSLTPRGHILREYALSMRKCDQDLRLALREEEKHLLRIGVTKTIGDYYIGPAVASYLQNPRREMDVTMDNTVRLLQLLEDGRLDLALVEGVVDKTAYQTFPIKEASFIGICGANHRFAGKTVELTDLKRETAIVREKGSGTRNLLERELNEVGCCLDYFARTITISNFGLITYLVAAGTGISFSYRAVVQNDERFSTFSVEGFHDRHEFTAVTLKHTALTSQMQDFLDGI